MQSLFRRYNLAINFDEEEYPVTLDEIAQLAGVSRTTASYVINGKAEQYRISQRTREKVMAVVDRFGFQPNPSASSLRSGKSRLIGLVIPDLDNKSFAKLAKLLESKARSHGFQLIIACTEDNPDTEKSVVNLLMQRRMDALITASCLPVTSDFYRPIQRRGTPVIGVDRMLDPKHFASVVNEDDEGAFILTNRLLEDRPASIAFISACEMLNVSQQRERGFQRALAHYQYPINIRCYHGEHFAAHTSFSILQQWLTNDALPEAIVTASFTLFEGVLELLNQHSHLAGDIKLATFGDHRFLDFLPFHTQSLSQQFDGIAEHVITLTLNALQGHYQAGLMPVARTPIWRQ